MTNTANNYLNTPLPKLPCPQCRANGKDTSGDNLRYNSEKNYWKCFSCDYFYQGFKVTLEHHIKSKESEEFVGNYEEIPERGLSKETCEKLKISSGTIWNKPAYCFEYDKASKVLLKERIDDKKEMFWRDGKAQECSLFGISECKDFSKPIIITEGEFDAASLHEKGFQSVSIRMGAGKASDELQQYLSVCVAYSEIILWLDCDEAGRNALKKCLAILPRSKTSWIDCKDFKDANEALLAGKLEEVMETCKQCSKPEGILQAHEIDLTSIKEKQIKYIPIEFLPKLNELTNGGFEFGTLNLLFAGVGSGKTTLLCHLGYHWFMKHKDLKIANLFYEENEDITPLRYVAIHNNLPVGKLRKDTSLLTDQQWKESKELFQNSNRLSFLGRNCKRTSEGLFEALDYLVNKLGFNIILLDHISYIIGRSGVSKHGERRDIDELLYKLQDFSIKNNCIILAVSHITQKSEDKKWDEGEIPSVYSGRGSGALAQIPDVVIALARNTKNPRAESILRTFIVKNRWGGRVGETDQLIYNDDTGHFEVN